MSVEMRRRTLRLRSRRTDSTNLATRARISFRSTKPLTDGEGHFVFERVLPGKGHIGRRMIFMVNEGATEVTSSRHEPL